MTLLQVSMAYITTIYITTVNITTICYINTIMYVIYYCCIYYYHILLYCIYYHGIYYTHRRDWPSHMDHSVVSVPQALSCQCTLYWGILPSPHRRIWWVPWKVSFNL